MRWAELAHDTGADLAANVVSLPTRDLSRRLAAIAERARHVVIDTPPGRPELTAAALEVAELVVVPLRPATADVDRVWPALDAAGRAGVAVLVVLSQVRARSRAEAAVRKVLGAEGIAVAATVIPLREAVAATFGTRPATVLAEVGEGLWNEVIRARKKVTNGRKT